MAFYPYLPLDPKTSQIRVLTVQPSSDPGAPIHCSLSNVSLDAKPSFEALSYVWGPTKPRHTLSLSGIPFDVGPSLHAALRALRQRKKSRVVWADAICINQGDGGEKAYQIPLMQRLYTEAERTVVWLGESNANIDALASWLNYRMNANFLSGQSSTWAKLRVKGLFSGNASRERDLLMLQAANGLFDIVSVGYWYRMWTFQEFLLPKDDPLCYCGGNKFRMGDIGIWKDEILDWTDEVKSRVDAQAAATGPGAAEGPLIAWMEALGEQMTALWRKSHEANSLFPPLVLREEFCNVKTTVVYLLSRTSSRACFLGHDRIFAIFGVCPGLKDTIPVDYEVPLGQVLLQVATFAINVEKTWKGTFSNFGVLPGHLQSEDGLPSWIPDFTVGSIHSDGPRRYYTDECLPKTLYIGAFEKVPGATVESGRILRTHGLEVGVIAQTRVLPSELKDIFIALHDLFSTPAVFGSSGPEFQGPSSADQGEKLAAAAGSHMAMYTQLRRERASKLIQAVDGVCNQYAAGETPEFSGPTPASLERDIKYLSERVVFITSDGVLGLGVTHIKVGDMVTVLNNERLPIILREESRGGPAQLVGTAYVDGLMDNEWLRHDLTAKLSQQMPTEICLV